MPHWEGARKCREAWREVPWREAWWAPTGSSSTPLSHAL
jgi:hypothetical protein